MIEEIISYCLREDIGSGDHSTLACVPKNAQGMAELLVKEEGVIAGVEMAQRIAHHFDPDLKFEVFIEDGAAVKPGEIVFVLSGKSRSILTIERLILNFMQRMSAIASLTKKYVERIKHTDAKLLDTRKTTPGLRYMEKEAVRLGGGMNHRFGLYDMIMLKDNHIDYAGGIEKAVSRTKEYLKLNDLDLKIEVEVRNQEELDEVLLLDEIDRIMLDNFSPSEIRKALLRIPGHIETEASGGITLESISEFAETGVNFISVGALTHSSGSMDLSLKAVLR